jgi:hypothetical protein
MEVIKDTLDLTSWLLESDFSNLMEGDTEVNGVSLTVSQEAYQFCDTVTQYMYLLDGRSFKRTGTKEISYERWVDTWWGEWEVND